jgi:putative SOS response-associated peptidase YedK
LETLLCGRFTLELSSDTLEQEFDIQGPGEFEFKSYNIAPHQNLPIIHLDDHLNKHVSMMQWGFLPSWAKSIHDGPRPMNARLETVADNALFKGAFQKRRCLVPASGFYEWDPKTTPKQPHYFTQKGHTLFAFAGLWSIWEREIGIILSFTIITKEAEESVKPIHGRMPFVLNKSNYDAWLKEGTLPKHCPSLTCHPVSLAVNSPQNNEASLIE